MTAITDMVELETREDIAIVKVNNPPVNALSRGVRDGIHEGKNPDNLAILNPRCHDIQDNGREPEKQGKQNHNGNRQLL